MKHINERQAESCRFLVFKHPQLESC